MSIRTLVIPNINLASASWVNAGAIVGCRWHPKSECTGSNKPKGWISLEMNKHTNIASQLAVRAKAPFLLFGNLSMFETMRDQ